MDLINALIDHAVRTSFDELPAAAIEGVKKSMIDTLGCLVAGSAAPGSRELVALLSEWGGKAQSSILVFGGKVPTVSAVLANCTMARALDLDDIHEGHAGTGTGGHLGATFVPVMLALSEYVDRPVSGREFILASALGADLSCRLRLAVRAYHGWLAETFAPFGIVAGGGRLMGFDARSMLDAMGIAYSQCSGNAQCNGDAAMTVRLQQGFGAKAGVMALMLAERGFTGAKQVLQGTYGFYPLYCRNEYSEDIVTRNLGREFEGANVSVKPYPCCKLSHGGVDAVVRILEEKALRPDDIEQVILRTNTWGYRTVGESAGIYEPRTVVDAQFSAPYTLAVAMLKRDVFIDDFTPEAIGRRDVLDLAKRVKVCIDPELEKLPSVPPGVVEVLTRQGGRHEARVDYVKGHPRNPMTFEDLVAKFYKCVPFSARPMSSAEASALVELIRGLEKIPDVRTILSHLA